MDVGLCGVIYVDRHSDKSGIIKRDDLARLAGQPSKGVPGQGQQGQQVAQQNIRAILGTFNEVFVCLDGASCLRKITQLDESQNPSPTVVLINIPPEDELPRYETRTPSPTASRRLAVEKDEPLDIYGVTMLSHLHTSITQRTISKLILPVAILGMQDLGRRPSQPSHARTMRYLDAGATDVLTSPIAAERIQCLPVHAYRIYKEVSKEDAGSVLTKRNRKLSWIGIEEERPFAYLRESMVSGLMENICNPENLNDICLDELTIDDARKKIVCDAVGSWSFSAHDFTSDELVYAALLILEHALQMPELAQWRIPTSELTTFVLVCRRAYNDFVLYHNFRHVVDVLQAIFYFLVQIGLLPAYRNEPNNRAAHQENAVVAVLKPFDALTLLIAAIGHDVGHPGVNNAFLVALNAPLAQLYNDRSVLEAFHCAAYSQILRRYWPAAFSDVSMRKLMITSILATDMGLHFKYIMDMGNLQEKLAAAQTASDGLPPKASEENRDLVCGLLIKCADISNVARKYAVAAQWARILTDEFSNQGAMEKELNLPTCLFGGPPDPTDAIKMAESQLGFMNIFARPLFEGVSDILPPMSFTLNELGTNKAIWQERIEAENSRKRSFATSPMTQSIVSLKDAEGSSSSESAPIAPLALERDSLFGPARNSMQMSTDQNKNVSNSQARSRDAPPSPMTVDEGRRASAHRYDRSRSSGNAYMLPPLTSSNRASISPSRRSSKDVALDQLDQLKLGSRASYSHDQNQNMSGSRGESADASLTTILVRSRPGATNGSGSLPPSPVKSSFSQGRHAGAEKSLSSAGSHATSNATAVPVSPSTKASSLESSEAAAAEIPQNTPIPSTENPFLHPNAGTQELANRKDHSASAPDVSTSISTGSYSDKTSNLSHAMTSDSDGGSGPFTEQKHDIRQSRSHNKLRGLKFWKKKAKGSESDFEASP